MRIPRLCRPGAIGKRTGALPSNGGKDGASVPPFGWGAPPGDSAHDRNRDGALGHDAWRGVRRSPSRSPYSSGELAMRGIRYFGSPKVDVVGPVNPELSRKIDVMSTNYGDVIITFAGADKICGLGGADNISSGSDADLVDAGWGDDEVDAGSGDDLVYGGLGDDDIQAGAGHDYVLGEAGNDWIDAEEGDDQVDAGVGRRHRLRRRRLRSPARRHRQRLDVGRRRRRRDQRRHGRRHRLWRRGRRRDPRGRRQ